MEKKIREKFLINLSSRNPDSIAKFSKWLDSQTNPQSSFLALIEHSIDRFGYADVMDHDIAKKMHTEYLYFNNENISPKNIQETQVLDLKEDISTNTSKDNLSTTNDLPSNKTKKAPKLNEGAF